MLDHRGIEWDRENLRFGLLAAILANQSRTKKTDKAYSPTDFFPPSHKQQPTRKVTEQEIAQSQADALTAMYVDAKSRQKAEIGKKGNGS